MAESEAAPVAGLRERKKAMTRSALQREALRLFREHGYAATTVEQIAEAADVSPSTVFRYFPSKEELLVLDGHHSLADAVARAFAAQPPQLGAVAALRATLRDVLADLPPADRAARLERDVALIAVPELWSANLGLLERALDELGRLVAQRADRDPRDVAVRTLTGAVLGVAVRVFLDAGDDPDGDPAAALDEALSHLEAGLPL
ncbi:TetR/AcrR family transcriptional regulator [Pseudonocardia sp. MH-G8]|uniref:TetR/AcrR family transcriptional regulator n=1 Tax=Pseudonocardia sp. MH-G8 TaxID=1854588 RepID=UPI000BA0F212|nr:TetR/AcrR family transcriptional regulator [Pseudonocardia sp. MH-G8]OZM80555.1 TetR family transcriptional regulator [Pseudonocardia sp. MH-G8]